MIIICFSLKVGIITKMNILTKFKDIKGVLLPLMFFYESLDRLHQRMIVQLNRLHLARWRIGDLQITKLKMLTFLFCHFEIKVLF